MLALLCWTCINKEIDLTRVTYYRKKNFILVCPGSLSCTQVCNEFSTPPQCQCNNGYSLDADTRSCNGNEHANHLKYLNYTLTFLVNNIILDDARFLYVKKFYIVKGKA